MRSFKPARTLAALALPAALAGCTTVTPAAVKEKRDAGVTRHFDRSPEDVYQASVLAIDRIRVDHPQFSGLEVVEKDPANGTVIAEQRLDSAVVPGLGTKDAVGIFVAGAPNGSSDVTVVALATDQIPGSAGTYVASLNGAEARVFPAIDSVLDTIPDRSPVAAPAASSPASAAMARAGQVAPSPAAAEPARLEPPRVPASAPAVRSAPPPAAPEAPAELARTSPAAPAATEAARTSARAVPSALDRVYDVLHASSAWRPLVREVRADGSEEVRIGRWATLRESEGRIRLAVREGAASPTDAARLALDLERAGFAVDVTSEAAQPAQR